METLKRPSAEAVTSERAELVVEVKPSPDFHSRYGPEMNQIGCGNVFSSATQGDDVDDAWGGA